MCKYFLHTKNIAVNVRKPPRIWVGEMYEINKTFLLIFNTTLEQHFAKLYVWKTVDRVLN